MIPNIPRASFIGYVSINTKDIIAKEIFIVADTRSQTLGSVHRGVTYNQFTITTLGRPVVTRPIAAL